MSLHIGPNDSNMPVGGSGGPEGPSGFHKLTQALVNDFMKPSNQELTVSNNDLPPQTPEEKVLGQNPSLIGDAFKKFQTP